MTVKKNANSSTAITGSAGPAIIDLDALAYLDQAEVEIIHPHDPKKTPLFTVVVAGPGHPQTLALEEEERRANLRELEDYQREAKEAIDAGKPQPFTPEARRTVAEIRARNAKALAARIISASGQIKLDGEVIDLNKETAVAVLANPKVPFVFEQISAFVRNRENFTPDSVKAS